MTLPIAPSAAQLAAEQAAAKQVVDGVQAQVVLATQQIVALYMSMAGSLDNELPFHLRDNFARGATEIISRVHIRIRNELWRLVLEAMAAGKEAVPFPADPIFAIAVGGAQLTDSGKVPDWIFQVASTAQERAQALLWAAQALPTIGAPPRNFQDVMVLVGKLHQVPNQLERDVRWASNAAYNYGVREQSNVAQVSRLWVAERDACLHCLAYSGEVAEPFEPYPDDLTFYVGPDGNMKPLKPYPVGPIWGPPLHPNCRCNEQPYAGVEGYPVYPWERDGFTPADALQREARRSVLRGTSGSDSMPARLRAVSALLAVGAGLPKSVEARARAAVKAGAFGGQVG